MALDFNSVLIGTDNYERLVDFYSKALGKPGMADDNYTGWQVGSGWFSVGPHSEVKGQNQQPGRILIFFGTADVKGDFDRLKSLGAKVVAEPYQPDKDNNPDTWLATLADPDGNYFQLATPWEG